MNFARLLLPKPRPCRVARHSCGAFVAASRCMPPSSHSSPSTCRPPAADILLLHGLGVKLVIVCGAATQARIPPQIRVAAHCIQDAAVHERLACGAAVHALIARATRRPPSPWPPADRQLPAGAGPGAAHRRRLPRHRCAAWGGARAPAGLRPARLRCTMHRAAPRLACKLEQAHASHASCLAPPCVLFGVMRCR